jgi:hypothetical protein
MRIKELKQARDNIAAAFNLPPEEAARIVGHCNAMETQAEIERLVSGDFSNVNKIMDELGITADPVTESKPQKMTAAERGEINKGNQERRTKAGRPPRKAFDAMNEGGEVAPVVVGEILPRDYMGEILPEGTAEKVEGWLGDFASRHNIDLSRLHSQQWRAACMYIGEHIKQSDIIRDKEREKHNGGRVYSGERLEALLYVWAYFCGVLRQVPLVPDFVSFSGVSRTFFYDYDGEGLTSTAVQILKKAKSIEENGLGSSVAGGGAGAVGGIFLLKARHGYSETVTIQHASTSSAISAAELPKLTDSAGES